MNHKPSLKIVLTALFCIVALSSTVTSTNYLGTQIDFWAYPTSPYSYTVRMYNSTHYCAQNDTTGAMEFGPSTNSTTVMNQCLSKLSDATALGDVSGTILIRDAWYNQTGTWIVPKGRFTIKGENSPIFYMNVGNSDFLRFNLGETDRCWLTLENIGWRRKSQLGGSGIVFNSTYADTANRLKQLNMEKVSLVSDCSNYADLSAGVSVAYIPHAGSVGIDLYNFTGQGSHSVWNNVVIQGFAWGAKLHCDHVKATNFVVSSCNIGGLWLSPTCLTSVVEKTQFFYQGGYAVKLAAIGTEYSTSDFGLQHLWRLNTLWVENKPTATMISNGWNDLTACIRAEQGAGAIINDFDKDYQIRTSPTYSKSLTAAPNDRCCIIWDGTTSLNVTAYTWSAYTSGHVDEMPFIVKVPSGTVLSGGDNTQTMRVSFLRSLQSENSGNKTMCSVVLLSYPFANVTQVWVEDYTDTTSYSVRVHVVVNSAVTLAHDLLFAVYIHMGLAG